MANFYKALLEIDNSCDDTVHQTLIAKETMLTIYNDGTKKNDNNENMCIAFTVDDINQAYEKVMSLDVEIIEQPTIRPWGAINMSFYDTDHNVIYLRQLPNK